MSSAIPIIDHDHVRAWIETHKGRPACMVGTARGEDPGVLCIRFEPQGTMEELAWDKWLRWFERNRLALIVSGNGFSKLEGLIYFPSETLRVDATHSPDIQCSRLIGRRLILQGRVLIAKGCSDSNVMNFRGTEVRLVG